MNVVIPSRVKYVVQYVLVRLWPVFGCQALDPNIPGQQILLNMQNIPQQNKNCTILQALKVFLRNIMLGYFTRYLIKDDQDIMKDILHSIPGYMAQ